jgi:DNA-binding transcriptional regulator PaaX
MDTKTGIRIALQVLGTYGFDGVVVNASSVQKAFESIMNSHSAVLPNHDNVFRELKRQKLIAINSKPNKDHKIQLSLAGMYRLQTVLLENIKIERPKKWDGIWRFVFFDIPLDATNKRVNFSKRLDRLGFKAIKKGVWVFPFACENEVATIVNYLNIQKHVNYLEVSYTDPTTRSKLTKLFSDLI